MLSPTGAMSPPRAAGTRPPSPRSTARAHHVTGDDTPASAAGDVITESRWRYAGRGHTPGQAVLAADIAQDIALNHEAAWDEREPRSGWGGWAGNGGSATGGALA